jgi:hypothetical protein
MQNNNGVKQRFLDCFLKILDKKRKKWRELQYRHGMCFRGIHFILISTAHALFLTCLPVSKRRAHADRGSIIMMLRFLMAENGLLR